MKGQSFKYKDSTTERQVFLMFSDTVSFQPIVLPRFLANVVLLESDLGRRLQVKIREALETRLGTYWYDFRFHLIRGNAYADK
jgi:hypothetical protein